jgi:glutamate--cysteine ligase
MYFVYRNGRYYDVAGSSFKDFINGKLKNIEGFRPTIKDWEDHMSVAFTDVRLKGYLEMRGADGGPWDRICALPAIWVGLLYDESALKASEEIAKQITYEEVIEATNLAAKVGLKGKIGKFKLNEITSEILNISKSGLHNRNEVNSSGENETGYLSPLFAMLEEKRTLADEMLESYYSSWNKRIEMAFKNQMI